MARRIKRTLQAQAQQNQMDEDDEDDEEDDDGDDEVRVRGSRRGPGARNLKVEKRERM